MGTRLAAYTLSTSTNRFGTLSAQMVLVTSSRNSVEPARLAIDERAVRAGSAGCLAWRRLHAQDYRAPIAQAVAHVRLSGTRVSANGTPAMGSP